ncbi:MAG: hypothetical protein Q4G08_08935 [Capnocytophaga sp.]|nr:hypothetical protein [Capnocytophaga sp.]
MLFLLDLQWLPLVAPAVSAKNSVSLRFISAAIPHAGTENR